MKRSTGHLQICSETPRHPLDSVRLRLEPVREEYATLVFRHLSDPRLWTFFPALRPRTLDQLSALYRRWERGNPDPERNETWENWICFLRGTQTPVGGMQATILPGQIATIAYMFYADRHGQGYAREAAAAVIEHLGSAHHVRRVIAEMNTRNARSIRLAESLGFVRVEERIDVERGHGVAADEYVYELDLAGALTGDGLDGKL